MKNIILPIDFSTASYNASQYAVSLASVFKANVTFINAVPRYCCMMKKLLLLC